MGYRCIQKVVREFQGGLVRDHHYDLRHTTLMPFNAIVNGIRKGRMPSFVDIALATSKKIEETMSMREQMKDDEAMCKREFS